MPLLLPYNEVWYPQSPSILWSPSEVWMLVFQIRDLIFCHALQLAFLLFIGHSIALCVVELHPSIEA